jgi:hypothetical protein
MRDPELFTIAMVAAGIYALVRLVLAPKLPAPTSTLPPDEDWPEEDDARWHQQMRASIRRDDLHIVLCKVAILVVFGTLAISMCGK